MLRRWWTVALLVSAVGLGLVASEVRPAHAEPLKRIVGTAKNDVLRGTPAADSILGKAGNDTISGLAGNDRLDGGPGNDRLNGGPGADRITGGRGADRINCGPGNDTVFGDASDTIARNCEDVRVPEQTPPQPSTLCLGQRATIVGTGQGDVLVGTPANDVIAALAGNDKIDGSGGDDVICGDDGDDLVVGGAGTDTIESGPGRDTCTGGEGGELCGTPPVFDFRGDVSEADRALFRDALALSRDHLLRLGAVAIDGIGLSAEAADRGPFQGSAGGGRIQMYTGSVFWGRRDRGQRAQVVAHEYFHLVQEGLSRGSASSLAPPWLVEGSAQYVGTVVVGAAGLLDYGAERAQIAQWAREAAAPLATCAETAPNPEERSRCLYSLGFIAVEYVVARHGGLPALVDLFLLLGDGLEWRESFQRAFGRSVETFYVEFEAYRKTL